MGPIDLIRHPVIFVSIAFQDFVRWYFFEKPVRIVKAYWEYFRAFNEVFSFLFLVRTLFSPWKQIHENYPNKGLDLGRIGQTLTLNITTRVIGFLFRIVAFILGLAAQLIVLAGFLTFFFAWVLFPLLFAAGVGYLLSQFF